MIRGALGAGRITRLGIDALCERRVERLLMERHGKVVYPVSTDDLTFLIEQEAGDLDYGADLATDAQEPGSRG